MSANPLMKPYLRHTVRLIAGLTIAALASTGCAADPDDVSASTRVDGGGLGLGPNDAGSAADASFIPNDASTLADAALSQAEAGQSNSGAGCKLGAAGSFATDMNLDLFGDVVYFANGQNLPAGRYKVAFEDGCMKYNSSQPWTIHQDLGTGPKGWSLVGESSSQRVVLLPGTTTNFIFLGGYTSFEACVTANKALPAKEFDFAGGKLGIWVDDTPYNDNQAGEGGRNPKWSLSLLVNECPPDLVLF